MSNRFASLPLQRKVAMTLVLTFTAFAAISYVILSTVIAPAFDDLELEAAQTDLVRAERALRADIQNLESITADWALWDDMYNYVLGRNPVFYASNLERPTLVNLNLDVMVIYAADKTLLWSDVVVDGASLELGVLGIFGANDSGSDLLITHERLEDKVAGIVQTDLGPMIISARPILRSDDTGPIAGSLVMAQFLDAIKLASLQERTEVSMHWGPLDETPIPRADSLVSSTVLNDIHNAPALLLRTETPRKISLLGTQTLSAAMLFLFMAGVLVTVVMWLLLRQTMLKPIDTLTGQIRKIRESGDLSHEIRLDNSDEIGALATQFNNLTSEVHEARKALLFQTFKAGKADTAAEVLHNIRNAMTPMINGVERLTKAFRVADDLRVNDAVDQLRDAECPPQRADKLLEYIEASFKHIKNSNAEATDDMKIVTSQARQIEAILADQEKFANVSPQTENIAVNEVVDEATHVIPKEAQSKVDVEVDSGLDELSVHAHRIGLLQVMGNLILNAYESILRASRKNGHIQLSATREVVADMPMVRLTVRDNGSGFEDDDKNRVFQRGFTSKGEGDTTGLGLHWCANAVAGMGGRISAESAGAGKGAEFHVLLPIAQGGL